MWHVMEGLLLLNVFMNNLVEEMGHPQFKRREAATRMLRGFGPLAQSHLEAASTHPDLEIARRARRLAEENRLARVDFLVAAARPTTYADIPWIDQLPADFPNRSRVISHYLAMAHYRVPVGRSPDWLDYREATRLLVRDLFIQGQGMNDVVKLLDRMVTEELAWIAKNRPR